MKPDNEYVYLAYEAYKEQNLGCPELFDLSLSELIKIWQDARRLRLVDQIQQNQQYISDFVEVL